MSYPDAQRLARLRARTESSIPLGASGSVGVGTLYNQSGLPVLVPQDAPVTASASDALTEWPGARGGVRLSFTGLAQTLQPDGGVVISGDGLSETPGPTGGVILSR